MSLDYLALTQSTVRVLNLTQRLSAMSFSTFLILHFSACVSSSHHTGSDFSADHPTIHSPIASAIAPSGKAESLASGFMVLGRVWYQGEWSEAVVVWGSLAAHIASGVLGRVAKTAERKERRKRRRRVVLFDAENSVGKEEEIDWERKSLLEKRGGEDEDEDELLKDEIAAFEEPSATISDPYPSRIPTFDFLGPITLVHVAGYILIPITLNHSFLHRVLPSSSRVPYSSLSPTLFSYSYVAYALSAPSHRVKSAIGYALLTIVGGYHAIAGIRKLLDPMAPPGLRPRRTKEGGGTVRKVRNRGWQGLYLGGLVGVGIGLARLAGEGKGVPEWIGRKYEVILQR
ncbi:hypothetical protein P7C70_g856, partial [Phenoliferia sp. Uapishka_3]